MTPSFQAGWSHFWSSPAAPVALVMLADLGFVSMDGTVSLLELRGVPPGQIFSLRMVRLHIQTYPAPAVFG